MKRTTLFLFIQLLILNAVSAQYINKATPIWGKQIPGDGERKEVVWRENQRDGEHFTEVTNPTLEAFLPEPSKSNGKAVVVCPGGRMLSGRRIFHSCLRERRTGSGTMAEQFGLQCLCIGLPHS